jgi:hypothetical protein
VVTVLAAKAQHLFVISEKVRKTKKLLTFVSPKVASSEGKILSFFSAGIINFNLMYLGFENSENWVKNIKKMSYKI